MDFNRNNLIPYIPSSEYEKVAEEFLQAYYPIGLTKPTAIPIEEIAIKGLGLDVQYICLSEEQDIFGMTIFTDGMVEVYDPNDGVYNIEFYKSKTLLIDPEAVKKTNIGCKNNTLAHECVHWYKHRLYYKRQAFSLPKYAKYCKCRISDLPQSVYDENIMENQAIGIAPRILMPRSTFIEAAEQLGVSYSSDNFLAISTLAKTFNVSKESVRIRLKECSLL